MSERKRPWFQLHLSTCVVLMVVAGVLLFLNVSPIAPRIDPGLWTDPILGQEALDVYGWPFPVTPTFTMHYDNDNLVGYSASQADWKLGPYIVDAIVNLALIANALFFMERRIRRRRTSASDLG